MGRSDAPDVFLPLSPGATFYQRPFKYHLSRAVNKAATRGRFDISESSGNLFWGRRSGSAGAFLAFFAALVVRGFLAGLCCGLIARTLVSGSARCLRE
jgi:hypothetical protein